jgi:hypothetical protein
MSEIYYHGSSRLFSKFDLSHATEGDGKVKFGFGVYVTSKYTSAAHYSAYAAGKQMADMHYVYTVEIPDRKKDNYIAFKQPVIPELLKRAEAQLDKIFKDLPEAKRAKMHGDIHKAAADGKDFRKFLAKTLTGGTDIAAEKAASEFLLSIGVDFIEWPVSWTNPENGTNRAILSDKAVRIVKVDQVDLDDKKHLVEGSQRPVKAK